MDLIQDFIDYKSKQKNSKGKLRSHHTIDSYKIQLNLYKVKAGAMPGNKGKRNKFILNTEDYLYALKDKYAADDNSKGNSFRTHLAIIKSFFDFLISEKRDLNIEVPSIEFNALKKSVNANKKPRIWLNNDELKKLEKYIRDTAITSLRDRLLFEIALSTGARRTEIQSLRECDIIAKKDSKGNTGYYINSLMKGKDRRTMVDISKGLFDLINQYSNNGTAERHLFTSKKAGLNEGLNLSYMTQLVKRLTNNALGYSVSPHELRHTAVNQTIIFCAEGGDSYDTCLKEAQKIAGHSNQTTTESHYFNDEIKAMFRTYSVETNRKRYRDI